MRGMLVKAADLGLWLLLQLPLMLAMLVFMGLHKSTRWLYYRVSVARRWVKGQPLWQSHDVMIGVPPPPSEKT